MKERTLFLNCNADNGSGLGHFVRCYELARSLVERNLPVRPCFLGRYSEYASSLLRNANIQYLEVPDGMSFSHRSIVDANPSASDLVLVDTYKAPQDYYDFLTREHIRWAAFDDFGVHDFSSAELVINFRVGAETMFDYGAKREALGPRYMPIGRAFANARSSRQALNGKVRYALVCMGGTDIYGVGQKVARTIARHFPDWLITLVGSDCRDGNQGNIRYLPLQDELLGLLCAADLLISGGGRLKYEACYLGLPNAALSQTLDQHRDTQIMAERNLIADLGLVANFDERVFVAALNKIDYEHRLRMRRAADDTFAIDSTDNLIAILLDAIRP